MAQGNRGRSLEYAVKKLFESYDSRGIHCQQNHPEQLHDGTLVKRHGFDFQILYKGKFYAFDAKECALSSWPIDKVKPHQLKALCDVIANGGEGFFLVHFTKIGKLVKMDANAVRLHVAAGYKSIPPSFGTETTINILGVN